MTKGIIQIVAGVIIGVIVFMAQIEFDQNCGGYLKQAADANTAELALKRLDKAVKYAEERGLTEGYTSVFYKTEDDNIGYWYQNLKACQKELREVIGKSQLEQTNVLMKVRESLTDNGKDGTKLTVPGGIARYPYNVFYGIMTLLAVLLFGLGIFNIHES